MTKPIKTTNAKCRAYVRSCTPFTNSNDQLFGRWETPHLYVVYSYGSHWPLFMYNAATCLWYENEDKYSVTTSRHHGYAHPHFPTETRSCGWLRSFIMSERFAKAA